VWSRVVEECRPRVAHEAARAGALLYAFGAVLIALEIWVIPAPPFPRDVAWIPPVVVVAVLVGAFVMWRRTEWIPMLCWPVLAAIPVGVILMMALVSHDPSASSQLSFCWPVLFAAYYHRRVVAQIITALVIGAEVTLCVLIDPSAVVVEDAIGVSVILAALMVTLMSARDRVDASMRVLRHDVEHDPMTGLLSRRVFDADIETLTDEVVSLVVVDIDEFKTVNDSWGHETGDDVLRSVAKCLAANRRQDDGVYRLGGDEFAVLLRGCESRAATARAEEIRRAVETAPGLSGLVTVSLGVASMPVHARRATNLLAIADVAMYAAKRAGRNRVVEATQAA
jgi:diguanylate cyclase (GGDEF)-like protein